jgi:hypothetical protein
MTVYFGPNPNLIALPYLIPTDGLQLLLDANSHSPGSLQWLDTSKRERHFYWKSAPTYGADGNVLYFSTLGTNRVSGPAANSFEITETSGYTIFFVMKQLSLNNASAFNFYGDGAYNRGIFGHTTWSDNILYFDQGGCCGADTRTQVTSGGSFDWHVYTYRRLTGSSTRTISKNGQTLITNTSSAALLKLNSTPVDLITSDNWNARLNGFVVYNRGLSDDEVSSVSSAIRNYLSI